jgi:hypothetical protein
MAVVIDGTSGISSPDYEVDGVTGQIYPIVRSTAIASTSGTAIDFTGIPSWAKRITIMFNGVSGNGSSNVLVQLGTGSTTYTTSGYNSTTTVAAGSVATASSTAGLIVWQNVSSFTMSGTMVLTNITGNTWVSNTTGKLSTTETVFAGGDIALGAALTAVRITRVNGTDTFDAGTINIIYE